MMKITIDPVMSRLHAATIGAMMCFAYGVTSNRVVNTTPWLFRDLFDLTGKTDQPASRTQQKLMVQAVLADQFGLMCHREAREMAGFQLLPGRRVKLIAAEEDGPDVTRFLPRIAVHSDNTSETVYTAPHASMAELSLWLGQMLGRPVSDRTGIAGIFKIVLTVRGGPLRRRGEVVSSPDESAVDPAQELNLAVQSQLGLKLEPSAHISEEVLVIDRIHSFDDR